MLIDNKYLRGLFKAFVVLVIVFITTPLVTVVVMSVNSSSSLSFPPEGLTLRWFENYFQSPIWMEATLTSLRIGGSTALLTTALGTLAAYALTRGRFPGKNIIYVLLVTPLVVPTMVLAIAFYFFFTSLNLTGGILPIVMGHAVITFPIVLVTISASLQGVSENLEKASRSLGANRFVTFFRVVFPLMIPGIVSGALFSFLLSFDELLVPMFLGGVGIDTLPTQIWGTLSFTFDQTISAVSTLIILFMAAILVTVQSLATRAERKAGMRRDDS